MKMFKSSTILAAAGTLLLAASAGAHMGATNKDVVSSSSGRVWVNSFNNCVLTKWDAAKNPCTPGAVAGAGLELRTVYFAFDSAALTPAAKEKLGVLADALHKQGAHSVRIVGYTDKIGTAGYNDKLSQRRASAVAHFLKSHGMVVNGKFEVRGLGETSSQSDCKGVKNHEELKACLWRDRRVEVEVIN
ncbi:MAG: OmpA family protein [Alphaproteobacteria bacterium]